jgi:hypothetical protein
MWGIPRPSVCGGIAAYCGSTGRSGKGCKGDSGSGLVTFRVGVEGSWLSFAGRFFRSFNGAGLSWGCEFLCSLSVKPDSTLGNASISCRCCCCNTLLRRCLFVGGVGGIGNNEKPERHDWSISMLLLCCKSTQSRACLLIRLDPTLRMNVDLCCYCCGLFPGCGWEQSIKQIGRTMVFELQSIVHLSKIGDGCRGESVGYAWMSR